MGEYDNEELSRIVAELNRAAPSQKSSASGRIPASTASLDKLLSTAANRNASDVVIVAGAPAVFRINGALNLAGGPGLDAEEVRGLLLPLLEPSQLRSCSGRNRWISALCAKAWGGSASTFTISAAP